MGDTSDTTDDDEETEGSKAGAAFSSEAARDLLAGGGTNVGRSMTLNANLKRIDPSIRPEVVLPNFKKDKFDPYYVESWVLYHSTYDIDEQVNSVIAKLKKVFQRPTTTDESKLYDETIKNIRKLFGRYLEVARTRSEQGHTHTIPDVHISDEVSMLHALSVLPSIAVIRKLIPEDGKQTPAVTRYAPKIAHFLSIVDTESRRRLITNATTEALNGNRGGGNGRGRNGRRGNRNDNNDNDNNASNRRKPAEEKTAAAAPPPRTSTPKASGEADKGKQGSAGGQRK